MRPSSTEAKHGRWRVISSAALSGIYDCSHWLKQIILHTEILITSMR